MALADASEEQPLALGWVTWREEPQSLADAQRQGALVVFEGDGGKETYAIAPAALVHCSEETLRQLLDDLDGQVWNKNEKASISYRRGAVEPPEDHAGVTEHGIWVEQEFDNLGLVRPIREVLEGRREHIPIWRNWLDKGAGIAGGLIGLGVAESLEPDSWVVGLGVILACAVAIDLLVRFVFRSVLSDR